jgi:hypothetical protein
MEKWPNNYVLTGAVLFRRCSERSWGRKLKNPLRVLAIVVATLFSTLAHAGPAAVDCTAFDTVTYATTPISILMTGPTSTGCTFTTGPYGIVFAVATAEAQCAVDLKIQMTIAAGSSPIRGSNFLGEASSGVLTVDSLIPGIGNDPWLIETGQIFSPNEAPFTPTTITGQLTQKTISNSSLSWSGGTVTVTTAAPHPFVNGNSVTISGVTPSGYNGTFLVASHPDSTHLTYALVSDPGTETVAGSTIAIPGTYGTYSIADSGVTQAPGSNMYTLLPVPGGMTAMTPVMTENSCVGTFSIPAIAGTFTGSPNAQYWITVAVYSTAGGRALWANSSVRIFTY